MKALTQEKEKTLWNDRKKNPPIKIFLWHQTLHEIITCLAIKQS